MNKGRKERKGNKKKLKDAVAVKELIVMCLVRQDSPVNKLLYAREIPRYKQLVER